ncbi:exodeoxyribonuclease V subunit beta [Colwellia sp. 20A7]|uniref:exodeoxyribonuclease V subunit beta n=1 Tax=Colwellia sp. 20A7 TaxID=2689569 RepID=UPI00135A4DD2|nr:exodeoxyribonuclease V subunit beta [Colwellia sp. 20A7]
MSQSSKFTLTNLDSSTIPLTGRHLIEASAGTGKTYNITRIYLRLLLERELKVEEILLMTFTKDATQELRGRIDAFIREALNNWQTLCSQDPYFKAIDKRVNPDNVNPNKIEFLLKRALLFLDEAAIFTIHGFCQRALTQHAFASGLPFNANMSTNSSELVLEATQDWYRQLAKQSIENFVLVEAFWATPTAFVSSFAKAISHRSELSVIDVQSLVANFIQLAKQASVALNNNTSLLDEGLVAHKKPEEQEKRAAELVKLKQWLDNIAQCQDDNALLDAAAYPMPDYLLNGNRHPKAFKVQLAQVLDSAKEIKAQVKNLAKNINKAQAYQIVRAAIYQIRQQVKQTKEQLNCLDFDDLINTLADCLQPTPVNNSPSAKQRNNVLAQTLLAQYPVALVDEFQDTDPQQFAILQGIYYQKDQSNVNSDNTSSTEYSKNALYLIGDPKQAIYGFRGGDIFAYLNARSDCDYHWLMDTNWRSSPDVVEAYNQVFSGSTTENSVQQSVFGYGIDYQPVLAGKKADSAVDSLTNKGRALRFVHFTGEGFADKVPQSVRPLMATWCANEIVELLNDNDIGNDIGSDSENNSQNKKTKPKDIAILVRDGREASAIKEALLQANLASVFLSDRANLFDSEQAAQLIKLLKGILAPEDERLYLSAITCGLLGINATALYKLQQDESAYQILKFNFFDYREQWQRQGFISMAITIMHQHFDFSGANDSGNKSRALTNLLHLFEILQSASQKFLQPQELLYWFEQQCNDDGARAANDLETEQRLENDGDLIRIVTQHGAKGLEYPVVFIPFATRHKDPLKFGNKSVSYIEYHNEQGQLCLSLDGDEQAKIAMANEAYAESIRLLYVAITRAERRCYILSTAFDKYALSPLGKTLQWQPEQDIAQSLSQLVASSPNTISFQHESFDSLSFDIASNSISQKQQVEQTAELEVSKFIGKIERDWWLSSFSALSKNLRHGGISSPDRDSIDVDDNSLTNRKNDKAVIRFQLAKGAHSGNLLHDILEHSNFKSSDEIDNNMLESTKWPLLKYGELTTGFTDADLVSWLDEIVKAPMTNQSDTLDTFCLSDIPLQKTLRENEFYFPMNEANITDLEKLLTDHRNAGLTKANPNTVRLPSYKSLKGMMHGFIDLVFEQNGKYYVCDYKSSHLGDDYNDYDYDALRDDIEKNYYDLQYLIYSLALHRYLQQNLPDYDVAEHFGGIYYLYLRGMTNDKSHQGQGVYYRTITVNELIQLDDLFLGKKLAKDLGKKLDNKLAKEQQ